MQTFLDATNVTITIPLEDKSGNPIDATSVDYRVVDSSGVEKVARSALSGFVAHSANAVVTVPALANTMAAMADPNAYGSVANPRESRVIELFVVDASGNTIVLSEAYIIQPTEVLIAGVNSFQSLAQANLTGMEIANTPGWDAASEEEKITALIDAKNRISQLNFSLLNSNSNLDQSNINYIPESRYIATSNVFIFNGNLNLLTQRQFEVLPAKFKKVLQLAQVAEADALLGGDTVSDIRRSGLLATTVGESKQMFRAGKPVEMPVCRRALAFLGYYITFSRKTGRG